MANRCTRRHERDFARRWSPIGAVGRTGSLLALMAFVLLGMSCDGRSVKLLTDGSEPAMRSVKLDRNSFVRRGDGILLYIHEYQAERVRWNNGAEPLSVAVFLYVPGATETKPNHDLGASQLAHGIVVVGFEPGWRHIFRMDNAKVRLQGRASELSLSFKSEVIESVDDVNGRPFHGFVLNGVVAPGMSLIEDGTWIETICATKKLPPSVGDLLQCSMTHL